MIKFLLTLALTQSLHAQNRISAKSDMSGSVGGAVTGSTGGTNKFALDVNVLNFPVGGSSSVSVTNFPATQPVSGSVSVSNSVAVTGAFYQTTQPVSGTLAVSNFPSSQAVTGTFWQATQPISGSVSVSNFPATQPVSIVSMPSTPVTGPVTDAQIRATPLPVSGTVTASGPLTDTQLRAVAVPVSGTFWQATQPVSGTVTANAGSGTMAVSGTFWQATQPVSGTFWQATQPVSGTVAATQSGTFTSTATAITKGTQGSNGYTTQDLKDSGRVHIRLRAVAVAAGATGVETLFTLTRSADNGATTTGTSFVVTNGKRFRMTSITFATRGHATATAQTTTFNLRVNTAGACIVTSTPIIYSARSATAAVANDWDRFSVYLTDGDEILGDGTLAFCISAAATYTTNAPTWDVLITGFEY